MDHNQHVEQFNRDEEIRRLREALKDIADGAWNIRHGTTNLSAIDFARKALKVTGGE